MKSLAGGILPVLTVMLFSLGSLISLGNTAAMAEFRQQSLDNDFPAEVAAAAEEGKLLVVFFHQAGCPYCDKMRARVHPVAKVFDYFSRHFVMIESNIRGSLDVVMPDGSEGTERDLAKKLRVRATPVFIFFNREGKDVLRTTGFLSVDKFYLAGKYVVDGVYKNNKSFFRYLQEQ